MNRTLQYLNTVGVAALIAICLWQWRGLRDEQQRNASLDLAQRELNAKFEEQTRVLNGKTADLDDFRARLDKAAGDLSDTRAKLEKTEQRAAQLEQEKSQLTDNLAVWKTAVEERDARIQEANTKIVGLSDRLNESIKKFNALVSDYNEVVGKLNAANAASATSAAGAANGANGTNAPKETK
ncbi:MAG TPA: hypothetical protein VFT72_14850 [Opitutaceae bacterium]|nr:hypothetical protein [Opitutaceae bacterium]